MPNEKGHGRCRGQVDGERDTLAGSPEIMAMT
jgi:hypothetical protein